MKKVFGFILFLFFISNCFIKAQWVSSNGIFSGDVFCSAVKDTNLFIGSYGSGVFLTTDNGISWAAVNNGLKNIYVRSLAISDSNIFAGTDGGVFLSTDNGKNWVSVNNGLTYIQVNSLVTSQDSAGNINIFAGTKDGGVFRSTNNGVNWTAMNNGMPNPGYNYIVYSLATCPNGNGGTNILAGTYSGVYLSTDNGESWTYEDIFGHFFAVFANGKGGTDVLATSGQVIYLSTDYGISWTIAKMNLSLADLTSFAVIPNGSGGSNILAGTNKGGIFLSQNNGRNWNAINSILKNTDVLSFTVIPKKSGGTNIFAGTIGGGIYLSTDNGTTWTKNNNGVRGSVYSLAISYDSTGGTNFFAGTSGGGIYLSTNTGKSWILTNVLQDYCLTESISIKDTNLVAAIGGYGVTISTDNGKNWNLSLSGDARAIALTDTNIFAGIYGSGFYLSNDKGKSWKKSNSGLNNLNVLSLAVTSNTKGGLNLFIGTESGVFLSTDNGKNWNSINNGLNNPYIHTLVVYDTNLYAGTDNGIFLSTNYGTSWKSIFGYSSYFGFTVYSIAKIGTNIFVGTNEGIYLSTDDGTKWITAGNNFPDNFVRSLIIIGSDIFAGTDVYGIWKRPLSEIIDVPLPVDMITFEGTCLNNEAVLKWTTATETNNKGFEIERMGNDGTWRDIGFVAGKGTSTITNYYNYSDNNIPISGKYSYRIKQIDYNGTYIYSGIINVAITSLPKNYSLDQNYPNPFNPSTTINYQVAKDGFVSIKIYDVLGKEVKTLVNEVKSQGKYSLKFDGLALSSGVYFYKIKVNDYTSIKKMILTK